MYLRHYTRWIIASRTYVKMRYTYPTKPVITLCKNTRRCVGFTHLTIQHFMYVQLIRYVKMNMIT